MTRKSNGQFAKGNPGGPGRPPRVTEMTYLRSLAEAVPIERWQRIVEKAAADAEAGDHRARAFLAQHLMPVKPQSEKTSFRGSLLLGDDDEDDPLNYL